VKISEANIADGGQYKCFGLILQKTVVMDFRTIVEVAKADYSITHKSSILSIGSCFAENIGNRMKSLRFDIDVNPFGIQYNPASIAKGFQILLDNRKFTHDDLFYANDVWSSLMHHSCFSDADVDVCLKNINDGIARGVERIHQCDFYLITFGTAWVYEDVETDEVVSNCHKLPSSRFNRRRLSIGEIVESFSKIIGALLSLSPMAHFVFSVSPIRHWKDGAHENQISKSTLLLAIEQLCSSFPQASYFPSYEILLDDLRDYRFYDVDMVHPNSVAVEYIWEKMSEVFFDETTVALSKRVYSLSQAMSHRPFNANTDAHRKFLDTSLRKAMQLKREFPFLKIDDMIEYFNK